MYYFYLDHFNLHGVFIQWCLVEIKGPLKELPCTDSRVERGLSKEIEGEFCLWEQEIPKIRWICSIDAGQDCQEVVLEGANGPLCPIAVMHGRGNKLEGGLPLEGDSFFVGRAGFVIQDLEINGETPGCQTDHDSIVGGNSMSIALGLEGLLEDEVVIGVKSDQTGKRSVSSVKSLLSGCVMMKTWLEGVAMGGGRHTSGNGVGCLCFVDLTFWHCWARWPMTFHLNPDNIWQHWSM
jgi:hypothetical protein